MFLENETWELCPVKSNFNIAQLHVSKNLLTRDLSIWSSENSAPIAAVTTQALIYRRKENVVCLLNCAQTISGQKLQAKIMRCQKDKCSKAIFIPHVGTARYYFLHAWAHFL